jgi:hypothetical protein
VVEPLQPAGKVAPGAAAHALDGRLNDSFKAMNALLSAGFTVHRANKAGQGLQPGDFVVAGAPAAGLAAIAKQTGVDFTPLDAAAAQQTRPVRRLRIAIFQRYRGGNADEGWTRWLLEHYGFPFSALMDTEIKKGGLNERYDVIIFPDEFTAAITGELPENPRRPEDEWPPEYRSGIGIEGVTAIKTFVEKGGTVVTLGGAGSFAIEKLGLPLRNAAAGRNSKQFW